MPDLREDTVETGLLVLTRTATVDPWRSVLTRSPSVFLRECGEERLSARPGNSSESMTQADSVTRAPCWGLSSARVPITRTLSSLVTTMCSVGDPQLPASLSVSGPQEYFKRFRLVYNSSPSNS